MFACVHTCTLNVRACFSHQSVQTRISLFKQRQILLKRKMLKIQIRAQSASYHTTNQILHDTLRPSSRLSAYRAERTDSGAKPYLSPPRLRGPASDPARHCARCRPHLFRSESSWVSERVCKCQRDTCHRARGEGEEPHDADTLTRVTYTRTEA